MINTYNLFAVPVVHGKFVVPIDLHKKIIKYIDKNYNNSDNVFSCVKGFQTHKKFDGKKELNEALNIYLMLHLILFFHQIFYEFENLLHMKKHYQNYYNFYQCI